MAAVIRSTSVLIRSLCIKHLILNNVYLIKSIVHPGLGRGGRTEALTTVRGMDTKSVRGAVLYFFLS